MRLDTLDTPAEERGTYPIQIKFYDETKTLVAPDTAVWSLSTMDGQIINSRQTVTIDSPTNTEVITLSDEDLIILDKERAFEHRVLTIQATYTSNTLGAGLPLNKAVSFKIRNLGLIDRDLFIGLYVPMADPIWITEDIGVTIS